MRLSILLLIIGVCVVMGEPVNVAIPAAVPQQAAVVESKPFPSEPIVETPSSITTASSLPVHLLPLKLELGDETIEELGISLESTPALDVDVDNNDPSHAGEGLVDIGGDVNVDITILAGLEADAAKTAAGELTSFEGASEEEIKSILEGVVDEQDLDAFDGISDADIDADGDTMIETESSLEGKEEDEKDKEEHEKQEKKEEEEKEKEKPEKKEEEEKEKDKDTSGQEIEIESGIKVENPVNHGEVTVNYVENLNLKLRGGRHHKFRGLHHLARKLRLMKRIAKWFAKPVHSRLSLLRFAKYHKLRVLELKLRLMKLKFLTNAIKMLRLARLITLMKVKGDLTKLAVGHALFSKFQQPSIDVKADVKDETIANRVARIRAFKNLLRARRMARYRTMMTSPILSRRAFHSRAFTTSPIVSSHRWNRRQAFPFVTSPILSSSWTHPSSSPLTSRFVSSPIVSGHLLALRGVNADEPVDGSDIDNEGLYEDLLRMQHQQPASFPFTTSPIISEQQQLQHPYNIMLAGEADPQDIDTDAEAEADADDYDTTGEYQPFSME